MGNAMKKMFRKDKRSADKPEPDANTKPSSVGGKDLRDVAARDGNRVHFAKSVDEQISEPITLNQIRRPTSGKELGTKPSGEVETSDESDDEDVKVKSLEKPSNSNVPVKEADKCPHEPGTESNPEKSFQEPQTELTPKESLHEQLTVSRIMSNHEERPHEPLRQSVVSNLKESLLEPQTESNIEDCPHEPKTGSTPEARSHEPLISVSNLQEYQNLKSKLADNPTQKESAPVPGSANVQDQMQSQDALGENPVKFMNPNLKPKFMKIVQEYKNVVDSDAAQAFREAYQEVPISNNLTAFQVFQIIDDDMTKVKGDPLQDDVLDSLIEHLQTSGKFD